MYSYYRFPCSGIISAIAFSPTQSGMLAAGSYDQTTAIYREDNLELLYVLHGQEGGITHVSCLLNANCSYFYFDSCDDYWIFIWKYAPQYFLQVQFSKDGNYLYTGARKVRFPHCLYLYFMCFKKFLVINYSWNFVWKISAFTRVPISNENVFVLLECWLNISWIL